MKHLIFLIILSASGIRAEMRIAEGQPFHMQDITIKSGEEYRVPVCRRLLLKDINNLNEKTWIDIDGLLELRRYMPRQRSSQSFMEGRFKFHTSPELADYQAILHSGTKVTLFSTEGVQEIHAYQHKWWTFEETDCAGSSPIS